MKQLRPSRVVLVNISLSKRQWENIKMYLLSTLSGKPTSLSKMELLIDFAPLTLLYYIIGHLLHILTPVGYIPPLLICIFCICMTPLTNKFLRDFCSSDHCSGGHLLLWIPGEIVPPCPHYGWLSCLWLVLANDLLEKSESRF